MAIINSLCDLMYSFMLCLNEFKVGALFILRCSELNWNPPLYETVLLQYTAKTVVLKLHRVLRGSHHAFYTGVKFAVLVQHPVVLF